MNFALPWPHRLLVAASALYFVLLGVFALAWPADGDDLLIFYAAGEATRQGLDPYTPGRFSDPFSYPPAWVPFCVLLSYLPSGVAIWVWKALNVLFLVGVVRLSLKLVFGERESSPTQQTLVWCFSFLLWPTSITLFDGNTPLCVLFFTLLGLWLSLRERPYLAGVCLGFCLIKPNLVLPLFALLFVQGKWRVLFTSAIVAAFLNLWGMQLTGIDFAQYLASLKVYSAANSVADNSGVGLAKLLALFSSITSDKARLYAAVIGVVATFVLATLRLRRSTPPDKNAFDPAWPIFLILGVTFLGARGYELVFVIPVFVWLIRDLNSQPWLTWPALLLTCSFIVPQRAIELVYERVLTEFLPLPVYDFALKPFRSWAILTLVLVLALAYIQQRIDRNRVNNNVKLA